MLQQARSAPSALSLCWNGLYRRPANTGFAGDRPHPGRSGDCLTFRTKLPALCSKSFLVQCSGFGMSQQLQQSACKWSSSSLLAMLSGLKPCCTCITYRAWAVDPWPSANFCSLRLALCLTSAMLPAGIVYSKPSPARSPAPTAEPRCPRPAWLRVRLHQKGAMLLRQTLAIRSPAMSRRHLRASCWCCSAR